MLPAPSRRCETLTSQPTKCSQPALCKPTSHRRVRLGFIDGQRLGRLQWPSYVCKAGIKVENRELVVGDAVAMVNFCLYKQIASLVLAPDFPGWMAPVSFNWTRFGEFCGLTATLTGTWVAAGLLVGAYATAATADLPSALRTASLTWLLAMPVAAAQLVLATAVESRSLVGDVDFASAMPLAASGIGEPFVTASGVLALMTLWRCVYALYLDPFGFKGLGFRRQQFMRELYSFREALLMVTLMAGVGSVSLQVVQALDSIISGNGI
ncbi:hypothetical protein PLESTB_000912800 [Pleodorina starrii]|uniref:Uncharacterized protein n=1 Tax=Pleodorina starrii TaxID=330485 RepID=A0A9W6F332_9CHLO|nr:hypothetical protein PLESTM_001523900 [Pleodorina starrii]GLC54853.1 hypothetical protein PLESTB_000912800 [Pleodorina starrii]GLC73698.1 hypothetical protein PLESTF_001409700 [Pleodorina starrii]